MNFIFLSQEFYKEFSNLVEIERKESRPYILFVVCYNGYAFGIPFRSHINHPNFFPTSATGGIDFSKAVIISDQKYILKNKPVIRQDEFKRIKGKEFVIKEKFIKYIEKYKEAVEKIKNGTAHDRDLLLVKYSTLQNYHVEITNKKSEII
jgi:protein AbiQ